MLLKPFLFLELKKGTKKEESIQRSRKRKTEEKELEDEETKKQAAVPVDGNDITMGKGIQHDFEDMANVPNFVGVF